MKKFKLWNTIGGWVAFAIAAATYLLTIEPTASFWDCGEFISSAFKLEVGHPPGAPFFMLMGHLASLFASDPSHVAMCVNALSALMSAFTILFLFWTITALAKKVVLTKGEEMSLAQGIGILGAGLVGALAYTFSDTFWFSAVEGEVYASSSFFTAVVFWLILKWDEHADEEGSDRWLILIAYLMGLSIGVHLLNLLTIPAIVMVYYFRRYKFSWGGAIVAFLASAGILAVVLYGIIPGSVQMACWFELLFVNGFGCDFNTGMFVYLALLAGSLVWALWETYTEKSVLRMDIAFVLSIVLAGIPFFGSHIWLAFLLTAALVGVLIWKRKETSGRLLNTTIAMVAVILIGYSSYAAVVIRSNADTPMDQNSPDNVFALQYYLNREQYGDRPLLYGATYNAPVELEIKGNMCIPVEKQGHKQYSIRHKSAENPHDEYVYMGHRAQYKTMGEFDMLFPRMYSADPRHIEAYESWGKVKGERVRYQYCGETKTAVKPTFGENLRFFFNYQCGFMYWRYFMWNFAGRQNDLQGYGEITKGNWISGIDAIDNARLGDQSKLPSELRNNKGHNVYYMLPLLLGILGIVYQLSKRKKGFENFTTTFLLFFMTGLAIVIYLNQTPYQPRERDYAYAGSFYAFCIWIGLGVPALFEWICKLFKKDNKVVKAIVAGSVSVICLGVPALMGQQNWDDHDRSDRYSCRDFGANYLKSCEPNAIIFSNGDNDTFPLWYNQEVEGEGTDKRVCNLSYLQTDWYIGSMKRPYYESAGLPISWEEKDYDYGCNEVVRVVKSYPNPLEVSTAFAFVRSDDPETKYNGDNFLPTDQLYIPVNKEEVLASPAFRREDGSCYLDTAHLVDRLNVKVNRRLTRSEMMVLEMISTNHWQRPIYFAVTVGNDYYLGMEKYFKLTGMALQVTPNESSKGTQNVDIERMYDNMMHKFRYGNMNKKGIYIDETTMRTCRTHRMMFAQLAEALVDANDTARALEVLDYAEEMLPGENVPYDYTSATMAQFYYMLGQKEKGNRIMEAVADNNVEYLLWGLSLDKATRNAMSYTLGHQAAVLGFVMQNFYRTGQTDLLNKYEPIYTEFMAQMR